MASQNGGNSSVVPYAPKAKGDTEPDQLDRAGHAIFGLVGRAADTTESDLRAAREATQKLADQLRAANNQINELNASLRYYQDRTDQFRLRLNKGFLAQMMAARPVEIQ